MVTYTGMSHVHLRVADVERSASFYEAGLGMERVMTNHEGRTIVLSTPGSNDLLTLSDGDADDLDVVSREPRVGENGGIDHFGFRLADQRDLGAALEQLVAAGATVVSEFELVPGWPSAFVRDLDGYAFQI